MVKRLMLQVVLAVVLALVAVAAPIEVSVEIGPVSAARRATSLAVLSGSILMLASALALKRREVALPEFRG